MRRLTRRGSDLSTLVLAGRDDFLRSAVALLYAPYLDLITA
jgi:hypothetical protein